MLTQESIAGLGHQFWLLVTGWCAWSLTAAAFAGDAPQVDGLFDEWSGMTPIAQDPLGDAGGAFDVTELHAVSRGTELFVHFDTATVLNLQAGTTAQGTLRLEVGLPAGQHLTIDLRNRTAYTGNNPNNYVPWSQLDFGSMTTYAAERFEVRVDLAGLGVAQGSVVTINFSGSDSLSEAAAFALATPGDPPAHRSADRQTCTTFRIASLNTLTGGLLDAARGPAIGRLVHAAAADIYCFQEQNSDPADGAARLEELDPLGDGAAWNVHRVGDTIISSKQPIIPVPHPGDAAAVVDLGGGGAVLVFSIHPPCCGYIGSSQDTSRINEMLSVVSTIEDFRSGALGANLLPYRYAPIIIIGDWNLVGSRVPLDLAENVACPGLSHRLLRHLVGEDVDTWRDLTESPGSFAPGMLDLMVYDTERFFPKNGFVLNSGELNAAELQYLGLQAADSLAADHLMIVADFAGSFEGDLNGDGMVNAFDLATLLGAWGANPGHSADLTGDGGVDAADLAVLLGHWGVCG